MNLDTDRNPLANPIIPTQPNPRYRRRRRTLASRPTTRLRIRLVHNRLRPHRLLDLEPRRLGLHSRRTRLCWWNARAHLFWYRRPRYFSLSGQEERVGHGEVGVQTAQYDVRRIGHSLPLVWMVWV